jgi:hypothetical protein
MTNFSIFEKLRSTFHSVRLFYLHRPQTYHGNLKVKKSYNASKCTEECELHFVRIVRVRQLRNVILKDYISDGDGQRHQSSQG